jgi:hypothetical protein
LYGGALALALLPSSFAQKVKTEWDKDVDITRYKKFAWKEHPFLKSHPEAAQFTVAAEVIRSKANELLMKRGYEPVDFDPEIYITEFHTARMQREEHSVPVSTYPGAYSWPGAWYSWSGAYFTQWETYIEDFAEGILVLDVVDAKTNKLLWRAGCKAKIDDMKERHKEIEDTVKKALKSFPPEYKKK